MRYRLSFFSLALLAAAGCSSSDRTRTQDEESHRLTVAEVTEAASAAGQYVYTFDPSGLATSVGSGTVSYAIARTGDTMHAGADTYRFDSLGRVNAIDDLSLTYGPDGQIAAAARGAETISYVYDEDGHRILKKTNGTPTAAYMGDTYVTATELDEPVRAGNKVVGL
jgi:hypothetical protein